MALNITNSFIVNITAQDDATQNVPINKGIAVSFDSNFALLVEYGVFSAPTILTGYPIPYYQIYIRNIDPVNQLQVSISPQGNVSAVFGILNPGGTDFILLVAKTGGAVNAGYDSVTLGGVGGTSCKVEYFIGA